METTIFLLLPVCTYMVTVPQIILSLVIYFPLCCSFLLNTQKQTKEHNKAGNNDLCFEVTSG